MATQPRTLFTLILLLWLSEWGLTQDVGEIIRDGIRTVGMKGMQAAGLLKDSARVVENVGLWVQEQVGVDRSRHVRVFVEHQSDEGDGKNAGIVGQHVEGVTGFYNVRFGHVPSRWSAPVGLANTSGHVRDQLQQYPYLHWINNDDSPSDSRPHFFRGAIGPSTACYQFLPFIGHFGVEDCLFLDIHTPATPCQPEGCETARPKLPVLVFIHGGGFVYGDKSQAFFYDGASLARDRNMVVVSIQYRIGAMGFMAHKDQPPSELNAGLLDQRVALQWLQDNIEHFGGDRSRVVLSGHSAGGISACVHLGSPQSQSLFHSVVMLSGPCDSRWVYWDEREAHERNDKYIDAVWDHVCATPSCRSNLPVHCRQCSKDSVGRLRNGTGGIECLRGLEMPSSCVWLNHLGTVDTLLPNVLDGLQHHITGFHLPFWTMTKLTPPRLLWSPVVAPGSILPVPPLDAVSAGVGMDKVIMSGYSADEGTLFTRSPIIRAFVGWPESGKEDDVIQLRGDELSWGNVDRLLRSVFAYDDDRWPEEYQNIRQQLLDLISMRYYEHTHYTGLDQTNHTLFAPPSYADAANALEKLFRDYLFACPALRLTQTRQRVAEQSSVRRNDRAASYVFQLNYWSTATLASRHLHSHHNNVLGYVFGNPIGTKALSFLHINQVNASSPEDARVMDVLRNGIKELSSGQPDVLLRGAGRPNPRSVSSMHLKGQHAEEWRPGELLHIGTAPESMLNNIHVMDRMPEKDRLEAVAGMDRVAHSANISHKDLQTALRMHHCDLWNRINLLEYGAYDQSAATDGDGVIGVPVTTLMANIDDEPLSPASWPSRQSELKALDGMTIDLPPARKAEHLTGGLDGIFGSLSPAAWIDGSDSNALAKDRLVHVGGDTRSLRQPGVLPARYDQLDAHVEAVNHFFDHAARYDRGLVKQGIMRSS